MRLRSVLFAEGMRYRVHFPVPACARRSIDIAFTRQRVAVFVDGCFWHGCPLHGHHVRTNADWWNRKISRNRNRDQETDELLRTQGWIVVRLWEHDSVEVAVKRVKDALADAADPDHQVRTPSKSS